MRRRADQQPPGQPPAQRPRQDQRVVNPTPIQAIRGVEQRPAGEAFNQTTRRVVEYYVTRASRRDPIYQITVHPIAVDDMMSRERVIAEVRIAFAEAFQRYRIPERTRGYLSVQSTLTQAEHAWDRAIPLSEAIDGLFEQVLEDVVQSNAELNLADLDWKFTIAQDIRGGAQEVKLPKSFKNPSKQVARTWQSNNVNCAAYAIVSNNYTPVYERDLLDRARELTLKMRWGETCDSKDLNNFVEKHPDYRITVKDLFLVKTFLYDFQGVDWVDEKKHVRLLYDCEQSHYGLYVPRNLLGGSDKECLDCGNMYRPSVQTGCGCQGPIEKIRKPQLAQVCRKCGIVGKHNCVQSSCKSCKEVYSKGQYRRCLITPTKTEHEVWKVGDPVDGSKTRHFAYDFESRIERTETTCSKIQGFNFNDDGTFNTTNLTVIGTDALNHKVDFVHIKSLEGDEEFSFEGPDCMNEFILFCLTHNRKNNCFWAHNASGYDARFIFDAFIKFDKKLDIDPMMRGGKLMQLVISGKKNSRDKHDLIFRDSMLHTPGSLANLAKDYCAGKMLKGYFPHLFDRYNNPNYCGQIPDIKYFDYSTQCKSREDYQKFLDWHANWHTENGPVYDLNSELKKYCKNDVDVLCCILKGF